MGQPTVASSHALVQCAAGHAEQTHAGHRYNILKMKRTVTNWPEYEAGLRRRGGSLT